MCVWGGGGDINKANTFILGVTFSCSTRGQNVFLCSDFFKLALCQQIFFFFFF